MGCELKRDCREHFRGLLSWPLSYTQEPGGSGGAGGAAPGSAGNIGLDEEAKRPLEQKREERDTRRDAAAPRDRAEMDDVPGPAPRCSLPPT